MSISIHLPSIMQQISGGQACLQIAATSTAETVGSLISRLEQAYPGLAARLLDGDKVQRFVNIYVNDADIRFAQQLATPVAANAEVVILTAVAGGSPAWQSWQESTASAAASVPTAASIATTNSTVRT